MGGLAEGPAGVGTLRVWQGTANSVLSGSSECRLESVSDAVGCGWHFRYSVISVRCIIQPLPDMNVP